VALLLPCVNLLTILIQICIDTMTTGMDQLQEGIVRKTKEEAVTNVAGVAYQRRDTSALISQSLLADPVNHSRKCVALRYKSRWMSL